MTRRQHAEWAARQEAKLDIAIRWAQRKQRMQRMMLHAKARRAEHKVAVLSDTLADVLAEELRQQR